MEEEISNNTILALMIVNIIISVTALSILLPTDPPPRYNPEPAPQQTHAEQEYVYHVFECWDGCKISEELIYGNNLTNPSELYNKCTDYCMSEEVQTRGGFRIGEQIESE
jgi:hypothetical protein